MTDSNFHEILERLGLIRIDSVELSPVLIAAWPRLLHKAERRLTDHGAFPRWQQLLSGLPAPAVDHLALDEPTPRVHGTVDNATLEARLRELGPWKKGPFDLFGTVIDAEWRSEKKWQRVQAMASPLQGRRVLDVGTGNGYFLLRAAGDGAHVVLGLEPSVHYCCQFLAINRYFECPSVALLPATCEEFPPHSASFDTVLSMGVLYHRRSPIDHLLSLRGALRSGGELILETLVVDGPEGHSLVPRDRYAQMRNVWFLPSVPTLCAWLARIGMKNIRVGPSVATTQEEQRTTSWHPKPSLSQFLCPGDRGKTIEGYPAPVRVLVVSEAP